MILDWRKKPPFYGAGKKVKIREHLPSLIW
jgi:hypothetical protein